MLEYQNIKIFLQKVTFQIDLKKCLWLKKLKTLLRGHIISRLKELQKTNQQDFRVQKVIKRKG